MSLPHRLHRFATTLLDATGRVALVAAAASLGCGGDLTLPEGSPNFELSIVAGNGQTGTVGQELPQPLVVKLQADGNATLSGRHVAFVSSSPSTTRFDPDTAVTNAQGEAMANWILGTAPGSYQAEARLVLPDAAEPPSAQLAASAVAGEADTMRALSPLAQPGRWDQQLEPLVVIVVDRFGNPVPNVAVEWKVESGMGELSQSETTTGGDGTTSVVWTIGRRLGVQMVSAKVKQGDVFGSPVLFSATVLF